MAIIGTPSITSAGRTCPRTLTLPTHLAVPLRFESGEMGNNVVGGRVAMCTYYTMEGHASWARAGDWLHTRVVSVGGKTRRAKHTSQRLDTLRIDDVVPVLVCAQALARWTWSPQKDYDQAVRPVWGGHAKVCEVSVNYIYACVRYIIYIKTDKIKVKLTFIFI